MRYAVILAGGGGTRLWPMSRREHPKQFLALASDESLLSATARRLRPVCGDALHVVTAAEQVELVANALPGLPAQHIIAEPAARNTGPAIGLAAALLVAQDPDAVIGIVPSDHHVRDPAEFARVCELAFEAAETEGGIVTVGIVPTGPETGFGYLEIGSDDTEASRPVIRFAEKPDRDTAEQYVASGDYLWNAGMFFARADHLLRELVRLQPATGAVLERIRDAASNDSRAAALAIAEAEYPGVAPVSIDYGVMEHTKDVRTIPGSFGWSDVGSWDALSELRESDQAGNVTIGSVVAIDASNDIVVADPGSVVAVAGIDDIIVIKSGNAVLVAPRKRSQSVRTIVAELKKRELLDFL